MKSGMLMVASVWLLALGWMTSASAADWPQWRGPQRTGISEETGLLKEWPKDGPKLVWQIKDVGDGYSTPSVVGDRLYLLTNKASTTSSSRRSTPKTASRSGKRGSARSAIRSAAGYPRARSTPTVDGESIYALGSDGDLACLETAAGKVRWQKNLRSEFGGKPGAGPTPSRRWSMATRLICTPGGKTATLVALEQEQRRRDLEVGDRRWRRGGLCVGDRRRDRRREAVHPVHAEGPRRGRRQDRASCCGATTKPPRAARRTSRRRSPATTWSTAPAARTGGGLVKVKKTDAAFTAEPVYFTNKLPNSIGGAVKVGDYLYGTNARPDVRRLRHGRRQVARQMRRRGVDLCRRRAAVRPRRKRRHGAGGSHAGRLPRKRPHHAHRPAKTRHAHKPGPTR